MVAAIYARKSTQQAGADADAKSVVRQIENAQLFARAKGWTVRPELVFSDDAVSGAETKKLVNRQRLLDLAFGGRPPFEVLIMRDASRLSRRDGDEAFGELKRLAQAGVTVWFYAEGAQFTYGDMGSNVLGFIKAEMNAEYRRQVGKWTKEAMARKARAGHVCGGRTFGYDNVRVNGHTQRQINAAEAAIVRQIFERSASGWGYTRIARQLNADLAVTPRPQQQRPAGWTPSTVYEVLHRDLYRGLLIWNKTRKRDTEGKIAVTDRPESEWLRLEQPDLRIVSEATWQAATKRLDQLRAAQAPHQRRAYRSDRESKYLLPGFGRCGVCRGGLHVRSRSNGRTRAYFYACTAHFNRGPQACPNDAQWPMEEINGEVLGTISGDVLTPALVDEVMAEARRMFEASARTSQRDDLQRELETLDRQLARMTDAIATGAGTIPALVERLRTTDERRREVAALLEQARRPVPQVSWRDVERRMRQNLKDWRSRLCADVTKAREAFRTLVTSPIVFTPCVVRGYRALRFEGRWSSDAVFGKVLTNLASPPGPSPFHVAGRVVRRRAA